MRKNAGMDTASVAWSINTQSSLKVEPTYILDSIREIVQILM